MKYLKIFFFALLIFSHFSCRQKPKAKTVKVKVPEKKEVVKKETPKEDKGILSTHLRTDGKYVKELWLEAPSSKVKPRLTESILSDKKQFLTMNGREVFRHAIKLFPEIILEALEYNNLKVDDIDLLIPHQANKRITQAIQKKMNLKDNQVISNIHKYGNTTAATIPIGLCEAVMENKLKKGDILVLAAFGSGFSWGSAILKW